MSAVHPLFESLIRPLKPDVTFMFDGIAGRVVDHDFVLWGGMSFQIESAAPALRAAIDAARAGSIFIEVPRVEIEESIDALKECALILSDGKDAGINSVLLSRQIEACIVGLGQALRS